MVIIFDAHQMLSTASIFDQLSLLRRFSSSSQRRLNQLNHFIDLFQASSLALFNTDQWFLKRRSNQLRAAPLLTKWNTRDLKFNHRWWLTTIEWNVLSYSLESHSSKWYLNIIEAPSGGCCGESIDLNASYPVFFFSVCKPISHAMLTCITILFFHAAFILFSSFYPSPSPLFPPPYIS